MTEPIKIHILNFEKYNPRSDVKRNSWLRFQNDFFDDPAFFDFNSDEKVAWIYMLCYASKQNTGELPVSPPHFTRITAISEKVLYQTIEKLKQHRIVEIRTLRGRYASDTHLPATDVTDVTIRTREEENLSTGSCEVVQKQVELLPTAPKGALVTAAVKPMDLISKINPDILRRWEQLYQDPEFLNTELLKALNWYEANPKKLPKSSASWSRALSNWFAKGWEWRAKSTKGNKPAVKVDIGEILKGFENGNDSKGV